MIRIIAAVVFIGHGLAHIGGLIASWAADRAGFADRPWLFSSGVTLQSPVGRLLGVLWLAAAVGLAGTGLGIALRQPWWPALVAPAAGASLVTILIWARAVPPGAWAGAALDLLILMVWLLPWKEQLVALLW
jgi:hypothetical protein